jgi:SRSO17 transposase
VIDRTAIARIQRLMRWLESFQRCFGHRAQRRALRTYVQGVFSDSDRKSMQAMLARVTEPVSYQAFQHFKFRSLGVRNEKSDFLDETAVDSVTLFAPGRRRQGSRR